MSTILSSPWLCFLAFNNAALWLYLMVRAWGQARALEAALGRARRRLEALDEGASAGPSGRRLRADLSGAPPR